MLQKVLSFLYTFYIPQVQVLDITEIIFLVIVIYQAQKKLKNTRAWAIIRGISVLVVVYLLAIMLDLIVIRTIFKQVLNLSLVAIVFLFEPEIKKLLESLGTNNIKRFFGFRKSGKIYNNRYSDDTISEIVSACKSMSSTKTGALIVIEMNSILNEYINTGIVLDSVINSQILIQIFEKNTPLHDGALIIRDDRIISATCYLPLTNNSAVNKGLGTRHRAGIGLSELTDAIVIIVSEETGSISVVLKGSLEHKISYKRLEMILKDNQCRDKIIKSKVSFKMGITSILRLATSILSSLAIWIVLINIANPTITKSFTVPVSMVNEDSLSSVGKTYNIVNGNYVDVKVTAPRNLIESFTTDCLIATADLEKLSYTYSVPVDVVLVDTLKSSRYSIDTDNAVVLLELDEITELSADVVIEPVGSVTEGYYLNKLTTNKSSVNIIGAKSIIKTIDKAVLKPNINNLTGDTAIKCMLVVYDKNGNIVKNKDITISQTDFIVNVDVLPTKEVPLNVNMVNTKSEDYELKSNELDIDSIVIAGEYNTINSIDSVDIEIDLDNEFVSESYIKSVNLVDYLPDNVCITGDSTQVNITMLFDIYPTKDIVIPSSSIELSNIRSSLLCNFSNEEYIITVKGASDLIKELDMSKLTYSLDLKNLYRGTYSLPLKIDGLPDGVVITSEVVVDFELEVD